MRSEIFKRNLALIKQENLNQQNTFTLGINKFADWTPEELSKLRTPMTQKSDRNDFISNQTYENLSIPESVDWR